MPPFPPLFLTRNSYCFLIRRLTNPWTYRASSFFTGYDKARHLGGASGQGKAVPDFDWTKLMSELLISPLTVTSSRKFPESTPCPD